MAQNPYELPQTPKMGKLPEDRIALAVWLVALFMGLIVLLYSFGTR